jgi:hypothetical protein
MFRNLFRADPAPAAILVRDLKAKLDAHEPIVLADTRHLTR